MSAATETTGEWSRHIAELDKTLAMLRESWMQAGTSADKAKWMDRINSMLDERSRLMRLRDAGS